MGDKRVVGRVMDEKNFIRHPSASVTRFTRHPLFIHLNRVFTLLIYADEAGDG